MNNKNMKRNGYLMLQDFYYVLLQEMNIMICELFYMYTVIENYYMWSYMLFVFPLSYKHSTGVLSV